MVLASLEFWCLCCNWAATLVVPRLSSGTRTMSRGSKPHLLCMTPSILGFLLRLRLRQHQWLLLVSRSVSPQLFSMTTSHLRNQHSLRNLRVTKFSCQHGGTTTSATTLAADREQPLLRRFHLCDAGLFLITANFPALATRCGCSSQTKG